MNAAAPLLQVSDMTKRFPGVLALDGIGLTVERGTIHGLLGENGAGKSTLLKILAGEYRPTSGRIEIDGEEVEIASPRHAHSLGIGIVYQELSLLRNLSVAHNISLANEPTRALAIDERAIVATARESLGRMGIDSIDPTQKVGSISIAERQLVEIAKVLTLRRPRILIFDEPTAALGPADVARLFRIMGELRDQGVAIIFVSHRYREVLTICDRATVLRNGRVVGDVDCREATVEHLVELTLGQKAETVFRRNWRAAEPGDPVARRARSRSRRRACAASTSSFGAARSLVCAACSGRGRTSWRARLPATCPTSRAPSRSTGARRQCAIRARRSVRASR